MSGSGLSAILADLERHKTIFDLDRDGLGEKLMDATAAQILRDMEAEVDPDGRRWAELSAAYVEYKQKVSPGEPMSVLHGRMRTLEELQGLRRITAREGVMVYGTDEQTRQEAEWFQEGNSRQPGRRFYAISAECEARLDEVCREHLAARV